MCEIVLHSGGLFRNAFVTRNHYSTVEGYAACQRRLQARITNQARPGHAAAAAAANAARYGGARSKPEYSSVAYTYCIALVIGVPGQGTTGDCVGEHGSNKQRTDRQMFDNTDNWLSLGTNSLSVCPMAQPRLEETSARASERVKVLDLRASSSV